MCFDIFSSPAALRPPASAHQPRVERDLDAAQGLRDRAPLLGLAGLLLEGRVVDARHLGLVVELDAGDLEAFAHLLEVDLGGGGDALGGDPGAAEAGGEGHREAAGVGGSDQLLGVGGRPLLEAGAEGVLPLEGAAPQLDRAVPLLESPFPNRAGFTYRHMRVSLVSSSLIPSSSAAGAPPGNRA